MRDLGVGFAAALVAGCAFHPTPLEQPQVDAELAAAKASTATTFMPANP